ncbi:serine hydrolase domain-containing protein [Fulvimonas soli]|jgi:CubicO group peptidase (beta-lactamase class C family)|uniref:CubicO group peptidase (Beta-lactamase class C family) n=1 Tax=Fulvimonas soli TaxID=155197 RepID=A0A316HS17_9GAMM|nr:serine hydrolase domain-containing protein [Fulvimonas soli]PWK82735.1 CubicO group peptidase (beta-lactamase class C family) [Fulvimonas soli]TNY26102.1 serine hydrolase [Fulvimonas soli]
MRLAPFLASLALSLATAAAHADDTLQAVDRLMLRYQGDVPGASLLVLKDGKPLVRRGYGLADLATHTPAAPDTDYRLASVSKQFTAAAVLLLAQDGRLHLDDPVRRWLPELPDTDDGITLAHLLSHTGGLIDYEDLMPAEQVHPLRDIDVLHLLANERRSYFPPGQGYRYSNGGYALLALVVERASGMPYPDFLRTRIFQPLGMAHTLAYVEGGPAVPHRAYGYTEIGGAWTRTDQSMTSAVLGDGGIYSSIDDLAQWDAARYDDRLLDAASRRLAFSPHAKVTGEPYRADYGYGWRLTGDTEWHSGETVGFRNVIVRWPKQHLTVVLLSNRNAPEPYETALAIGRLFLAP